MMACLSNMSEDSDLYKKEAGDTFEKFVKVEKSLIKKKPVYNRLFKVTWLQILLRLKNF